MRISDWSSDVCSSDLPFQRGRTADLMLTSIERRTSAAVAAAGAPLLDGDLGCDFERPSAMPSSRSEEHTSELQSLMRISYAVFCLKKKKHQPPQITNHSARHDRSLTQLT